MGRVFVIGVGMTKFEKPGKRDDDYPDFAKEAIVKALTDAKVAVTEIEKAACGYVYGDSTSGQRCIYEVGMTGIPIINVNNNCSTGATALMLAKEFIEFGANDCVLALGFEKMERGSLSAKFMDRTNPMDRHVSTMADLAGVNQAPIAAQLFGNAGIEYMKKYPHTRPEHFAKIAHKNHKHSVNNPYSQFRDEYSLDQIMQSPKVFGHLTKLQCCPTSDGAACVILASERFVRSHSLQKQAVEILGLEMVTDLPSSFQDSCMKLVGYDMTKTAADRLYQKTRRSPSEVQVVELHDCFSANELITYEALGLCPPGGAAHFIDQCDNTYGGKYVINPSGGLISKGHPLGATGLAQCSELCWQLRGEAEARQVKGAKLALQHNIGLGGAVVVAMYQLGYPELRATDNKCAAVTSDEGFKVTKYLKIFEQAMLEDSDNLIEKHRGAYGFKVRKANGDEGFWVIDARTGKGKVEFNSKIKPDVTLIIKDEDVIELLSGNINPQKAFFQGKVKIQGNMGMAMKLTNLQKTAAKKIDELRAKL